jgi:Sec-independent protein secretion pathway component TatC
LKKTIIAFTCILVFSIIFYSSDFFIKLVFLPLSNNGIKPVLFNLIDGFYIKILVSCVFTFIVLNPLLVWKVLNRLLIKWKLSHRKFLMFIVCYSSFLAGIIVSYVLLIIHVFQTNLISSPGSNMIVDAVIFINSVAAICSVTGLVFELFSILIIRIFASKRI